MAVKCYIIFFTRGSKVPKDSTMKLFSLQIGELNPMMFNICDIDVKRKILSIYEMIRDKIS